MLGIIGAMDEEVAQIKEKMTDVTVTSVAGMDFYQGKLGGKDAVVVRSGIGKVNAGMCSQILADRFHISAIVNTGIAGSLRAEINIGDIVVSTDAVQHDMDASGFGYRIGQIPLHLRRMRSCASWRLSATRRSIRRFGHFRDAW